MVLNILYDLTPIAYKNNNITGPLRLRLINWPLMEGRTTIKGISKSVEVFLKFCYIFKIPQFIYVNVSKYNSA